MNKLLIVLPALVLMGARAAAQDTAGLKRMHWLLGHWKGEYNGAPFYEKWELFHGGRLHQVNYTLHNGDTVVNDESVVFAGQQAITYEGKNGHVFRSTLLTDSMIVFENRQYGEKLLFRHLPDGRWFAEMTTPRSAVSYYLRRIAK